jgi:hypothetical protein
MYETLYEIDGQRYASLEEAERIAGEHRAICIITPEEQQEEAREKARSEALRIKMEAKAAQELYEQTPQGQLEKALSEGSRVTVIGGELDWPF